jgi:hypothetical protein
MEKSKSDIFEIIKDYHCDECKPLELTDISTWIEQFDETDRSFVLEEFLHLLRQGIYVSKEKALELLWNNFTFVANKLGYNGDLRTFIYESHFFNVQKEGKSQTVLFSMLDTLVENNTGIKLNANGGLKVKNFIYIDDVVATGKTLLGTLRSWLAENDNSNAKSVVIGDYKLIVTVFCMHQWALDNLRWSLKSTFKDDTFLKIPFVKCNYLIDNRVLYPSAQLNLILPIKDQSKIVLDYFEAIEAENYADRAFRKSGRPIKETFFSSSENRDRFEKIILEKGVKILNKVVSKKASNRPLGATYPHYKTLGTGTLFFTWRNISNTCPLVFWWDNPAHGWKCLFPLKGRGN